jgi:hypothetical protein
MEKTLLAHSVYFSLKDNSEGMKQQFLAAGQKYLTEHSGVVFYAAGVLAADCERPLNDRDFDVALHVVFEDKAAHDAYQKAERHLKFIEETKGNWQKVRIFDSYVSQ